MLGNLRTNLSGIAVDCLTSGDDQIIVQVADRACDGLGGSPGICAAQHSVGHQDAVVSAHSQSLTQNLFCLGKSHGDNGNLCAVLILQSQSRFQSCLVVRIHDRQHGSPVQRSVGFEFHAALCIRDLLNTNNNFHCIFSPCFFVYSHTNS